MSTVVERSILIAATTEQLDAITLNAQRFPEWFVGVETAVPDDTYPEPGGVVEIVYKAAALKFNMTMTSLRLSCGRSLLLRLEGMLVGKSRWVYSPEGDAVRVTSQFEYEMPGGNVGQALNKLAVEQINTKNLEKSLENLKALVEGA